MKLLICLPFLFAGVATPQGLFERAAVKESVEALNWPWRAITTSDADGLRELRRVLRAGLPGLPANGPLNGDYWPFPYSTVALAGEKPVRCESVRFLTPDVALADGWVRQHPALFVVKKEDGVWKIASVRLLRD